jgi:hypothetical protein
MLAGGEGFEPSLLDPEREKSKGEFVISWTSSRTF